MTGAFFQKGQHFSFWDKAKINRQAQLIQNRKVIFALAQDFLGVVPQFLQGGGFKFIQLGGVDAAVCVAANPIQVLPQADGTLVALANSAFKELNDEYARALTGLAQGLGHDAGKKAAVGAGEDLHESFNGVGRATGSGESWSL